MEVFVRDWLVEVSHYNEEGEDCSYIGHRLFLVAEAADGSRFAHDYAVTVHRNDLDAATARMDRLCAHVAVHLAAGGDLDMAHWVEVDPAYGSQAYQGLDALGYFKVRERREEEDRL